MRETGTLAHLHLGNGSWFFAEGATGPYFETFILMSNPNLAAADVTVTFLPDSGTPVTIERTIPPLGLIHSI